MDYIILVLIMGLCFTQGYNAYNSEKQNKVFNRRDLPLKDVKEYNHFCGKLIYVFGVIASITLSMIMFGSGWLYRIGCVLLIIEVIVFIRYYGKKEITFLRGH